MRPVNQGLELTVMPRRTERAREREGDELTGLSDRQTGDDIRGRF